MQQQTDLDNTGFAERAVVRVRAQAPETRLLPMAARRVAGRPEYQQVNRVDRTGAALNGGWTFLVNTATSTVLWTVGDPTTSISRRRWAVLPGVAVHRRDSRRRYQRPSRSARQVRGGPRCL